jgi:hypothetical protein
LLLADAEVSMRRRIAALSCCLSLVHLSVAAAEDAPTSAAPSLTIGVVNAAPRSGPIRAASLNGDAVRTYLGGTTPARRSIQDSIVEKDSWVERHPVWTGAVAGFSAGFALTYLATHDSDNGEFLKVMSPGAGALFWGGVCAGVGALTGWAVGRNRDE